MEIQWCRCWGTQCSNGDFPFEEMLPDDINHATELWTHSILMIAREYIPCHNITVRPQDEPWINHDIKKTIRTRNAMYRRYQRTTQKEHWDTYNRVKAETKINTQVRWNPEISQYLLDSSKQVYGSKVKSSIPTLIDGKQHINTSKDKTEHTNRTLRCTITSTSSPTESWWPRDNKETLRAQAGKHPNKWRRRESCAAQTQDTKISRSGWNY